MAAAERRNVTDALQRIGTLYQPYVDTPIGSEDIEDAKYFTGLARKNDQGTLSVKEAETVRELFEEDNAVIIDHNNERWVEADT